MRIFQTIRVFLFTILIVGPITELWANDKLIIISPHRKSLQNEYVPAFTAYYKATFKKNVEVDWIDSGGTSDDIRFVKAKFEKNPKSSGVDIFWGGGSSTFLDLDNEKLLVPHKLPANLEKEVPASAAGVPMRAKNNSWYATAMSSFGVFYNKKILKMDKLPEPKTWGDLSSPQFQNHISLTDPRRSGTATVMNVILLESQGWEKGWTSLTRIAGNTRMFTQSSSDPIKAVVSGDAAASMVIDFYAFPKIAELGKDNLGFVLPEGQTVLDPDPVGILKGAPNAEVAHRFVDFLLSKDAQKVLMMPLNSNGGPKLSMLGRMAVNTAAYAETEGQSVVLTNPFKEKNYLRVDLDAFATANAVLNDLFGAIIVDSHTELKAAWALIAKRPEKEWDALSTKLAAPPITRAELLALGKKWDDEVFRNKKINEWVVYAREKYKKVAKAASSH